MIHHIQKNNIYVYSVIENIEVLTQFSDNLLDNQKILEGGITPIIPLTSMRLETDSFMVFWVLGHNNCQSRLMGDLVH